MKPLFLETILSEIGIPLLENQKNVIISNVVHDLRNVGNETLYFNFRKKDHLDGNSLRQWKDFFIITDEPFENMEVLQPNQIIMVDNIVETFYKFTSYYRHLFALPVIAVTGTCGKTTTKEMIKHILHFSYTVQATIRNFNHNDFYLKYLVGIDENTDVAVIETGVAEPDDILLACRYIFPTIGIMTMIDLDHTDKFPSFDDYVMEKEKLINCLPPDGTLIINSDDPYISAMKTSEFKGKLITFGKNEKAVFHIKEINKVERGMSFTFTYKHQEYKGYVPGLGEHTVYNAIASIIAAHEVNIEIETSIKSIASFSHLTSDFQIIEAPNNVTIIDDTWKFNVPSFQLGLELLQKISSPNQRKIVVLGKPQNLGNYADVEYKKMGKLIVDQGIDKLITKGYFARDIARAALRAGMNKRDIFHFSEIYELKSFLSDLLQSGDLVFFKISQTDNCFADVINYLKTRQ
jgi:UDP-N-acetylmuramoyl-tripeptide--D-alanyl-D-alanine ligase